MYNMKSITISGNSNNNKQYNTCSIVLSCEYNYMS